MIRGGAGLIAGAAIIVLVLAFAADMAHAAGSAAELYALLLVTYAAGLALGWLGWGRKGATR